MITLACTTEKNIGTPNQLNNAIEQSSTEKLPYFELITADGKITSDQFLADSKPEFLLFISPN